VKPAKVAVSVSSNCLLAVTLLLQQTEQEVVGSLNVEIAQQKALAEAWEADVTLDCLQFGAVRRRRTQTGRQR
jgi:hypothetical protein